MFGRMKLSRQELWERFQQYYSEFPTIGLALDLSRMKFADDFFSRMDGPMRKAFSAMDALERGAIANPDENRMVGHYWLRNAGLAPTPAISKEITDTVAAVTRFAADVHGGRIVGAGGSFRNLLVIGIGGSALGPQFVAQALGHPKRDKLKVFFFDNTDPDGMDKTLAALEGQLGQTLCLVISKSGGTKETRNGMLEAKAEYEKASLNFARHAVAVTGVGSELDGLASKEGWIARFPMWDWVGGRTSELSAVGLLPAALQGVETQSMLEGAKACDDISRSKNVKENPAAQLALAWFYAGNGKGQKDMVVLPYKDRLELFSRYLQQLIMESLGKEHDLDGKIVNQGIAVYGNKGSTDQHAYIQQLRDGINNFFVTFIQVLKERAGDSVWVEPGITSGDFLNGFLLGTRSALFEKDRESITITIDEVSPFSVGVLIALYERAVGFYASLVNINAYHQPGVEAGKKAATGLLALQKRIIEFLRSKHGQAMSLEEIAEATIANGEVESVFKICQYLAANPAKGISSVEGKTPFSRKYFAR
jgi:glucose-6-phosphate isomerase